ncbi:hypothetical protein [Marinobacter sp. CHS3-4]|uniref:hypothetical protein n=1 Tax=Marinobacter sp. CHS3-4 TaxID=3045174 RepID=UPI0024B5AFC1|nr:hypothetical protein [Marinobacter sp. CHS3-4]MDI9245666.1 hypothetical protein [Marinobacter sp. CHS3-4]
MRTFSALKLFLITVLILILAACGGGGGGNDDPNAGATKKSQPVSVSIGEGAAPVSLLESPAFKDIEYTGDPIEIPKNSGEADQLLTAFDASGRIVFMTLLKPGASTVKVNAETTVMFFLSQVPGLGNALDLDNTLTVAKIFELEEVGALVEFISSTPGWGELSDDSFTVILAEAISAILTSDIITAASSGATKDRTKSVSFPSNQDSDVVKPTYIVVDGEEDVAIPPSQKRQFSKDGLLVSPQEVNNSTFDLEISNTDSRTVVAIVAEQDPALINSEFNPLSLGFKAVFVGGGNFALPGSSVLKKLPIEITDETTSETRLYTYGPGKEKVPTTGLALSAYRFANFASIIDVIFAPALSLSGIDPDCFRATYSQDYFYYLASEPLKDELSTGNNPVKISSLIFELYKSSDSPSVTEECSWSKTKDIIKKKAGVLGALWTAAEVVSDLVDIASYYPEVRKSEASHVWNLVNRLDTEINMTQAVFWGVSSEYLTTETLEERSTSVTKWTDDYQGDCVETAENNADAYEKGVIKCNAFYFDGGPGTNGLVNFTVYCKKPADTKAAIEDIPCRSAEFQLEPGAEREVIYPTALGSSVIKFKADFDEFKEYKSELLVIDSEGAEKLYILRNQIFGLFPHVVPYVDDVPVAYDYIESEKRIESSTPISIFCCEEGQTSATKAISLRNEYQGIAIIKDYQWMESSPNVSVDFPSNGTFIGAKTEKTFEITYTGSDQDQAYEQSRLRIYSKDPFHFSKDSVPILSWDKEEYSSIELLIAAGNCREEIILTEPILFFECYWEQERITQRRIEFMELTHDGQKRIFLEEFNNDGTTKAFIDIINFDSSSGNFFQSENIISLSDEVQGVPNTFIEMDWSPNYYPSGLSKKRIYELYPDSDVVAKEFHWNCYSINSDNPKLSYFEWYRDINGNFILNADGDDRHNVRELSPSECVTPEDIMMRNQFDIENSYIYRLSKSDIANGLF